MPHFMIVLILYINLSLWKHAYSNILKILSPKNENFQKKKVWHFSYFCSKHRLWVLVRAFFLWHKDNMNDLSYTDFVLQNADCLNVRWIRGMERSPVVVKAQTRMFHRVRHEKKKCLQIISAFSKIIPILMNCNCITGSHIRSATIK